MATTAYTLHGYAARLIDATAKDIIRTPQIRHAMRTSSVFADKATFVAHVRGVVGQAGFEYLSELLKDSKLSHEDCRKRLHDHVVGLIDSLPSELAIQSLSLNRPLPMRLDKELPSRPDESQSIAEGTHGISAQYSAPPPPIGKDNENLHSFHRVGKTPGPSVLSRTNRMIDKMKRTWQRFTAANERTSPQARSRDAHVTEIQTLGIPTRSTKQTDTSASQAVKTYLGVSSLPGWLEEALGNTAMQDKWHDIIPEKLTFLGGAYAAIAPSDADELRLHSSYFSDVEAQPLSNNEAALEYLKSCTADRLILRVGEDNKDARYLTFVRVEEWDSSERAPAWHDGLDPDRSLKSVQEIATRLSEINPNDVGISVIAPA